MLSIANNIMKRSTIKSIQPLCGVFQASFPHDCNGVLLVTIGQIPSDQHSQYRPKNTIIIFFYQKTAGLHVRKARWFGAEPNSSSSDTAVVERKQGCQKRLNLQSKCFFLGAITSCVVALQTARATSDPVSWYCAAAMRSVRVCPDIFSHWCLYNHLKNQPHRGKGKDSRNAQAISRQKKIRDTNWPFKTATLDFFSYPTRTN